MPILAVGLKRLLKTNRKEVPMKPCGKKLPTFSIIVPAKDEERACMHLGEFVWY